MQPCALHFQQTIHLISHQTVACVLFFVLNTLFNAFGHLQMAF